MPVQHGADGKLRKARMWAFTDQHQVFYDFTDTKAGEFPAQLLAKYAGRLLLVDGGSEFNEVEREKQLLRGGCWSTCAPTSGTRDTTIQARRASRLGRSTTCS